MYKTKIPKDIYVLKHNLLTGFKVAKIKNGSVWFKESSLVLLLNIEKEQLREIWKQFNVQIAKNFRSNDTMLYFKNSTDAHKALGWIEDVWMILHKLSSE